MGNTAAKGDFYPAASHLFHTPPTSPTAPTPPRLPSASLSPMLEAQSLTAVSGVVTPEIEGVYSPSCLPRKESTAMENATSGKENTGGEALACGVKGEVETVQEMGFTLIRLLEQHRASLGLSSGPDAVAEVVGQLRRLLVEKEKMAMEILGLKETIKTEREEWLQFQSDLQVAVSVAERLRLEAEEALCSLRDTHRDTEQCLAASLHRQSQSEREEESLRAELTKTRHQLLALTSEHQQRLAELDLLRQTVRVKLKQGPETQEQIPTSADTDKRNQGTMTEQNQEISAGVVKAVNLIERLKYRGSEQDEEHALKIKDLQKNGEPEALAECPGGWQGTEDGKNEEGSHVRNPQRIVMLSERSRSLSQIPLPSFTSAALYSSSQNLNSTLSPVLKSQEAVKGRRMDWLLQRQDSWSRSPRAGKQDDDLSSESPVMSSSKTGPQDGFSMLLRRHGGSRRNSLLRWSQSRTKGYKNIEITNFSSSWEDGLAFCALYHTYLPTHIPYSTLKPEEKMKNLDLAFHTGESVGIKAILAVEEMLREGGPDWQRVLKYVETMYRHFEM